MNRLVKFLGYNPKGVQGATATLVLNQKQIERVDGKFTAHNLYKYSAIDVGKTDKLGNKVYYSLVDTTTTASGDEY